MKWILLIAIIFGSTAFMLDAFFAHGLKNYLGAAYSDAIQHTLTTASRYQLMASLFLLILLLLYRSSSHTCIIFSQILLIAGVIFFCCTIYCKYLLGLNVAMVAPLGGIAFMVSFLALIPLVIIL